MRVPRNPEPEKVASPPTSVLGACSSGNMDRRGGRAPAAWAAREWLTPSPESLEEDLRFLLETAPTRVERLPPRS